MDENKKIVNAVHEKDLEALLEKIGLKDAFISKQINCKFCKQIVDINNIYSVLPESGTFNIVCDKPVCITFLLQYLEERKKTKLEQD